MSDLARDIATERSWTRAAARIAGTDPTELITFAEGRAGVEQVRDLLSRPFDRETLEELADARNYLCWWATQTTLAGDQAGEITEQIGLALAAVCTADFHARRARDLHHEERTNA